MINSVRLIITLMIISLVFLIINLNTHKINNELKDTAQIEEILEHIETDIEIDASEDIEVVSHGYYISSTINENDDEKTYYFINHEEHYIPFYKKQIQHNYNKGLIIKPKYIVIHETANTAVGANANAN